MRSQPFHHIHSGQNHRHRPVRSSKLQLFDEVRYEPKDLLVLGTDPRAFFWLRVMLRHQVDYGILDLAVSHNLGETVLERAQPGKAS
ncbi:MAG: hypothetical protein WB627_20930 [Candidatus Acidiferrum sp.]